MAQDPESDTEPEPDSEAQELDTEPGRRRRRPRVLPSPPDSEERGPRRVYRTRRDRLVGGVCAGLARAFGIDATFVRVVAVLTCFVGGAGAIAYLTALFLLPLEPPAFAQNAPESRPRSDPSLAWAGGALIVGGALVLSRFEVFHYRLLTLDRGALWPALLAGLGVLLVASRRREAARAGALAGRRWSRPRRDRLILGVASGFARYASVDTNLVRVALAVIAVWSYGIGVLLYLAVAAFVPEDPPAD